MADLWVPIAPALRTARATPGDNTAELAAVRDAVGEGMRRCLRDTDPALTQAFGHAPGVVSGTPFPWGMALWAGPLERTGAWTPSAAGLEYAGLGGGEDLDEGPLDLIVGVSVAGTDLPRIQALAEAWEWPLRWFVSANPTLGGTVEDCQWRSFEITGMPWGGDPQAPIIYAVAVAHTRVSVIRVPPVSFT